MLRFDAMDLRRFFTAVDTHLPEPAAMTVIGGSAVALYGASSGTQDVDTYRQLAAPLEEAVARARLTTGLDIPVLPAPVAEVPYYFEDRLQSEPGGWRRLTVYKLDPHDLALSKASRGWESDLAAIAALHAVIPLDLEVLVTRYLDEMCYAVGDPARLDLCFVLLVERLFGETAATQIETRLRSRRTPESA
jgi:hypothetical protein